MNLETLKHKLGEKFINYRIYSGRGAVFINELEGLVSSTAKYGVLLILIKDYFHWQVPLWVLPLVYFLQKFAEYKIGKYDNDKLGWWQKENDIVTSNTNPFWERMNKKLDKILENI